MPLLAYLYTQRFFLQMPFFCHVSGEGVCGVAPCTTPKAENSICKGKVSVIKNGDDPKAIIVPNLIKIRKSRKEYGHLSFYTKLFIKISFTFVHSSEMDAHSARP